MLPSGMYQPAVTLGQVRSSLRGGKLPKYDTNACQQRDLRVCM